MLKNVPHWKSIIGCDPAVTVIRFQLAPAVGQARMQEVLSSDPSGRKLQCEQCKTFRKIWFHPCWVSLDPTLASSQTDQTTDAHWNQLIAAAGSQTNNQ